MLRYALIYGGIAGAVAIGGILMGFALETTSAFFTSEYFGYLMMLIALTLVFVGVKRYRDMERGGVMTFLQGLTVGLAIAVVAGLSYMLVWEAYSWSTGYVFMDEYMTAAINAARASGLNEAALEARLTELADMRAAYDNPLFRLPLTFMEIFPVGLVVSLVSAAILRKSEVLPAQN